MANYDRKSIFRRAGSVSCKLPMGLIDMIPSHYSATSWVWEATIAYFAIQEVPFWKVKQRIDDSHHQNAVPMGLLAKIIYLKFNKITEDGELVEREIKALKELLIDIDERYDLARDLKISIKNLV